MQNNTLKARIKTFPQTPGVYLFKNRDQEIIYIGKAKNLKKRVLSYFNKTQDIKTQVMLEKVQTLDYQTAKSELAALLLEDELIKKYQPRYNILQRDDKTYPYLKLTVNEKWPRLVLTRKKEKDGALYFGKFKGGAVKEVLRLVKKLFPIRWCKQEPLKTRQQPCLYFRIGRCSAPCIGKIDHPAYMQLVKGVELLLKGQTDQAINRLKQEMGRASQEQDYERAAYLRDKSQQIEKMFQNPADNQLQLPEKLEALEGLKAVLGLSTLPMRIEAFDVSNISGKDVVASMAVFFGGNPFKKHYRKFKIRSVDEKPNDVAAIKEVVLRRYSKSLANKLPLPNLILIDGGLPQVKAAYQAMKSLHLEHIDLMGLAKKQEEVYFPHAARPLNIIKSTKALHLLQHIRDEAHRFAISYHRLARKKRFFA